MGKKFNSEAGIYKRKQESKKTRKHAFDQDSDQEKEKKRITVMKKERKKNSLPRK